MKHLPLVQVCLLILTSCGNCAAADKPPSSIQFPAATQPPASANSGAAADQTGRMQGQPESRRYPYAKDIKADTLFLDSNGKIAVLGEFMLMEAMGAGGRFTGIPGGSVVIPTGKVKIWVFRRIDDSYKASLRSKNIDVHEGGAYIVEYDKRPAKLTNLTEHLTVFTYLGEVDTQLNQRQLAAKFRIAP